MEKFLKVLYVGLANAGKTSIILTLEKEYKKLSKLSPTLGIERTSLDLMGAEAIIWDFGGQDKFREKYLRDNRNFIDTDLIFYVIDIKDEENYEESFKYYKKILKILKKYEEDPEIIVCIHKYDPDLDEAIYDEKYQELKKEFIDISKKEIKIFKTSIYNKKTLIEAFSYGVSKLLSDLNKIDLILLEFLDEQMLEGVLFFEKNSLIISEAYKDEGDKSFFLTVITNLIDLIEKSEKKRRLNELYLVLNRNLKLLLKHIIIDKSDFFVVLISKGESDIQELWNLFLKNKYPKIEEIIKEKK
ncbi:MAG: hypothetical protein GF329_14550 [Candidatus Lokiarchaeota archaeon]|nr:hypothetical protein [Candidatus Lokiarchaeota archaeon]